MRVGLPLLMWLSRLVQIILALLDHADRFPEAGDEMRLDPIFGAGRTMPLDNLHDAMLPFGREPMVSLPLRSRVPFPCVQT